MRFLLIPFSFVIGLICVEFGLRGYFFFKPDYDIEMWRYARELKVQVDDARSHVHRINTKARIMGVDMQTNSLGFRDKELNMFTERMLAVGDSFTLGFGVPFEKTFVQSLETKFNQEVVNAGIGNYNLEQELALWRVSGKKLEPKHVIWSLYVNDGEPTQKYSLGELAEFHIAAFLKSTLVKLRALSNEAYSYVPTYQSLYDDDNWGAFEAKLIELVKEFPKKKNLTIVILSDLRNLKDYPFRNFHNRVQEFFKKNKIQVIDTLPIFLGHDEASLWVAKDDPHPNILAHQMIAELIYKEMSVKGKKK